MRSRLNRISLVFLIAVFFLGQRASAEDNGAEYWTLVAIPDVQVLSQYSPKMLNSMAQWIVDNQASENIQMVIQLGDIVHHFAAAGTNGEYATAKAAMDIIDGGDIPLLLVIGNHDYNDNADSPINTENFNTFFPPARYTGKDWFGGAKTEGKGENIYYRKNILGQDYLFMAMEWCASTGTASWASSVLENHQDCVQIVATHSYLSANGKRADRSDPNDWVRPWPRLSGAELWDSCLKKQPRLALVFSGHCQSATQYLPALGENGNLVNAVCMDYTNEEWAKKDSLGIFRFYPKENRVVFSMFAVGSETYSTHYPEKMNLHVE